MPGMSTVFESVKTAATVSPTESEIATVAYQLWLERRCPIGSDQEDWSRAEAMLKNAVVTCEDLFRRPSIPCYDSRTDSATLAEFPWEGHWEVWEREWVSARWVWDDVRASRLGVSNRAWVAGKAE
jgi:Protein of unknown function (DUF2934)